MRRPCRTRGLWRKPYGVVQTGAVQMLCYQCLGARQTCHNMCDAWNVYCVGAKSERRFLCFSCRAETDGKCLHAAVCLHGKCLHAAVSACSVSAWEVSDGKCLHAAVLRYVGPTMSYMQLQWLPGGCGHKLHVQIWAGSCKVVREGPAASAPRMHHVVSVGAWLVHPPTHQSGSASQAAF